MASFSKVQLLLLLLLFLFNKMLLFFLTKGSCLGQGAVCLAPPPPAAPLGRGGLTGSLSGVGGPTETANHQLAAIRDAEAQNKNT